MIGATAEDIRMQQQDMIREQDKGLERVSNALRHQQRVGLAMQDEVKEQNGTVGVWLNDTVRGVARDVA